EAIAAGVEVIGDIELFARLNDKPVIAVTGSNGKSTVVTLAFDVLKMAGFKVGLGGNIGTAVLDLLAGDFDVFVLELSSFQLD
ncbi:UDP-N-acetylmuramoyl-L-alanine--D-glutamate ligase, partial [Streptomyces caniscabiei]